MLGLLYLYILIGIVILFGLSVYIAAVGWEKVLQDDVCAEVRKRFCYQAHHADSLQRGLLHLAYGRFPRYTRRLL